MLAKFRHTQQAIAYLRDAIESAHGSGLVQLSAFVGGSYLLSSRTLPSDKLLDTLQFECRQFPEATVVVGNTEKGEVFAAIQCTCSPDFRKHCVHHCKHSDSRPLMLVLTAPESAASRDRILEAVTRAIHMDLKAERQRSDACENENLSHVDAKTRHEKQVHDFQQWMKR